MKNPFLILLLTSVAAFAQTSTILPFGVKIGGQQAKAANEIYATVAEPVAANAEIEVEGTPQLLILNVVPSNAKGEIADNAVPVVILGQNTNKVTLDATMDKTKLAPGIYLANIVQGEKGTSRVLFTIK